MKLALYLFFFIFFLSNKSISSNIANDLEKLSDLYKNGMITKEEFNKSKSIILKNNNKLDDNKKTKKINKNTNNNFSKSNQNYKNFKKRFDDIKFGRSSFKLKWKNINGKYKYFKWDDKYMGFEVKEHNLICIWETTYPLWDTVLNNQIFYDLKCSDGSYIKKGSSRLYSNYGQSPIKFEATDSQGNTFYLLVSFLYGDK